MATFNKVVICKSHDSSNTPKQNIAATKVGEEMGNSVSNDTLPLPTPLPSQKEIVENNGFPEQNLTFSDF